MPAAIYLPEVRDDVDQVYASYELQQPGLGERFLLALRRTLNLVEANPKGYGEVDDGIRATILRRFPFVVYCREELGPLLVLAIRHGRDDPSIWRGRA